MTAFKDISFNSNEYIYADSNVLLEYMGYNGNSSVRNQCNEIIASAYNSGTPLVVSNIALDEIKKVIIFSTFKSAGYRGQREIKELRKKCEQKYNELLWNALNRFSEYKNKIMKSDVFLENVLDVSSETYENRDDLMFKHNIFGTTDALHLALAQQYGIDYFLTCDGDFKNLSIPDISIIYIEDK